MFIKNVKIILIYFVGILHWLFFFLFVDYYNYTNDEFDKSYKIIKYSNYDDSIIGKNIYTHVAILNLNGEYLVGDVNKMNNFKYSFKSIKDVNDNIMKGDKDLLTNIKNNFNIKKLFELKKFTYSDWRYENYVYDVIKNSLENKIIPFHSKYGVGNAPNNDRFLGGLMYTISPQIIFSLFFESQSFFIINLLLMYTIGFIGCLLIKKYYKLGFNSFIILFIIYNFNGYFVEKISAYGPHILGYYFTPFIIFSALRISEMRKLNNVNYYKWSILWGLSLTAILLQGSLHLYVQFITFTLIWTVFNYRLWKLSFLALIISFLSGSIRILPAIFAYGGKANPHAFVWGGYQSFTEIIQSFYILHSHLQDPVFHWWERSLYISYFGFIFIVVFSMWAYLKIGVTINFSIFKKKLSINDFSWIKFKFDKYIYLTLFIIVCLSIRFWKNFMIPPWIPLLNAESMTTRYMIIPLLFLLFISVINLQGFINKYSYKKLLIYIINFCSLFMTIFIFNHSRIWRMHKIQTEENWYHSLYSIPAFVMNDPYWINKPDDIFYIFSFWLGLIISIISILFIIRYCIVQNYFFKLRFYFYNN